MRDHEASQRSGGRYTSSEATMRRAILGLLIALGVLSGAPLPLEAAEATKVVGVLFGGTSRNVPWFQSFLDGLQDQGYVEGQNMRIEFRSAEGHFERLPSLAAELVALKPDVILSGFNATTRALKDLTAPCDRTATERHDAG